MLQWMAPHPWTYGWQNKKLYSTSYLKQNKIKQKHAQFRGARKSHRKEVRVEYDQKSLYNILKELLKYIKNKKTKHK